jgi:hypothetical protein
MIERRKLKKMPPRISGTSTKSARRTTAKLALFGPPPLIEGEDSAAYNDLLVRVSAAVNPTDFFEEIWVREIVDLVWEATRLRRLKVSLLNARAHDSLVTVLAPLVDESVSDVVNDWARRETNAVKWVNDVLKSADLSIDAVMAETMSDNLDYVERIEHMIAIAESRRDAVLYEIDRHRATIARTRRPRMHQLEQSEIEVIDVETVEGKNAA